MAHEPPSSSSQSQTLETLEPSLTRSLSKLNAKAPEFVPRVPAVISPPPPPPQNIIHLFNPIHHHPHPHPHPHHQHVAAMQFHHHHNHNHQNHQNQNAVVHKQQQRVFNGGGGGGGGTGFVEPNVAVLAKEKDVEVVKDESTQKIINQAVKSSALDTHFISLPLAMHPQLVDKLVNFQNSVAKTSSLPGKSIFIEPKTFHLTVLMLRLYNKERVDAAVTVLEGISGELKDALGGRPVSIKLKGLDIMRGSRDKAQVLYAPVEVVGGEDRLLRVCKIITDAFIKGGLVFEKDCQRALKLHATVMNAGLWRTFDARGILEKYGSEKWGEYRIPQVHLSQRFVFDANGYYHCCASIPLP